MFLLDVQALNLTKGISYRRLRVELAKLADNIEKKRYKPSFSPAAVTLANRMSKISYDPGPHNQIFNSSSVSHLDLNEGKSAHTETAVKLLLVKLLK